METGGFFINPAHVAAIGAVQGSMFFVFPIGVEEGFGLQYQSPQEATDARAHLAAAVSRLARA